MPLNRRRFLRSATGAALSLPFLESLAPRAARAAAATAPARRLAVFYSPIGVIRSGFFPGEAGTEVRAFKGFDVKNRIEGAAISPGQHPLELTPTLEPLAVLKDKVSLITGLDRTFQNGTDVHAQCASCFLSSAAPYEIKTSAWPLDRTLDHLVADAIGKETPFRTLEFSANSHKDNKESIYFDNISWYGTGHVAPSLRDPRKAYRRLFGAGDAAQVRNVTDLILADARDLKRELGTADQDKLAEYFDSLRSIEERIGKMERMRAELDAVPLAEPSAAHLPRGEYMRLMGDLMVVALQTGLTNVATFMAGPERWDTPFTFEGLFDKPRSHHGMSHKPKEFVDDLLRLDRFHMEQFAYLAEKMDGIVEADGSTLLDNTLFTFGSGLGDGSTHQYNDLPIVVAGSGGGRFRSGQHVAVPDGTPLANLWLSQAEAMGLRRERFADSTGLVGDLLA